MSEHDTEFCAHIGADRPTFVLLMKYVDEITPYWFDVGIKLVEGSYMYYLNVIKEDHPNDVEKCCHQMLQYWLQVDVEANWNKLIYSLEIIGLTATAARIKQDILLGEVY